MNAFEHLLHSELRFPQPPFRICGNFAGETRDGMSAYLESIRSWRLRVLEFLKAADGTYAEEFHYLSERAQRMLATFLDNSWTPGTSSYADQSPYNLKAFPQGALEDDESSRTDSVLEVLRWRAGVVDYLCDAPDAFFPAIESDESVSIEQFLNPIVHKELCWLCLTEFEKDQIHPEAHDCVILKHARAKWPSTPPVFRVWAEGAKKKSP